mmetsp:Transcript_50825/g.132115  ORF Transcript_50825/g.132115 Transcript_50825/m.132115 type:complete len:99 (-) Transcript_50825:760-1056(-)
MSTLTELASILTLESLKEQADGAPRPTVRVDEKRLSGRAMLSRPSLRRISRKLLRRFGSSARADPGLVLPLFDAMYWLRTRNALLPSQSRSSVCMIDV